MHSFYALCTEEEYMKEWDNIILDQSRKGSDHPTFGNADIIFRIKEACKVQIWKKDVLSKQ